MSTPVAAPAPATAQLVIRRAEMNAYYKRAVESDEYRQTLALWREAIRRRDELEPVPRPPMPTRVKHDLDEWLELVDTLEAAERRRTVHHNALTTLINNCENHIQSVVHQKDRLLASLATDLAEVMDDTTAAVERLNGARNPGEAIERGVADAWQELPPLRARYDSIRQAQDWVMNGDHRITGSRSEYLWTDDLASDLALANLDTVFSSWKSPPRNKAIQGWGDQQRLQPWPADPVEQLVWLCTSDAEVWCPTTKQLDELKDRRLRERAHPNGEPKQQQQERGSVLLNTAPRKPDYSRVMRPIAAAERPAELTELGAEQ